MSKQPNKTLIGAFVVCAIALVVGGLMILGSGKFFSKQLTFVMFFDGSVKGLQVGAPVTFRGVKIGEVKRIVLHADLTNMSVQIPVYVEIDPKEFKTDHERIKPGENYKKLIERGLKARLEMQSIVTGQLMIGLDFYPDKPIKLVGLEKKYPEIPTIPTTMEELAKTIQNLPIREITERLNTVLEGLDSLVHSPEVHGSFESMNKALQDISRLAKNIDAQIGPRATSVSGAADAARSASVQAEKTFAMKEGVPGDIAQEMKNTLTAARLTLEETQKAVRGVREIAVQNANMGYQLNKSLEQMTALSRSMRSLADYIDRHPEALIRGKHPQ